MGEWRMVWSVSGLGVENAVSVQMAKRVVREPKTRSDMRENGLRGVCQSLCKYRCNMRHSLAVEMRQKAEAGY